MKTCLKIICSFFLAFSLFSCDGDVRFTTPQPSSGDALKEVPALLRGKYTSDRDSLYIGVNDMLLVRSVYNTIPLADTARLGLAKNEKGRYVFLTGNHRSVDSVTADSIRYISRNVIMNCKLGKDTLLKSFNGSWWLSLKKAGTSPKEEWAVMQVSLHKNKLSVAVPLLPRDEKKSMQERMEENHTEIDSAGVFSSITSFYLAPGSSVFIASANPEQLKNLEKRGLFRPVANFIKVK